MNAATGHVVNQLIPVRVVTPAKNEKGKGWSGVTKEHHQAVLYPDPLSRAPRAKPGQVVVVFVQAQDKNGVFFAAPWGPDITGATYDEALANLKKFQTRPLIVERAAQPQLSVSVDQ